jgi:predicted phosphoribosyltransferase
MPKQFYRVQVDVADPVVAEKLRQELEMAVDSCICKAAPADLKDFDNSIPQVVLVGKPET